MNKEQFQKRMAEISAELEQFNASATYTAEDMETIEKLGEEYEGLEKQLQAAERLEQIQARSSVPVRQTTSVQPKATSVEAGIERKTLDPKQGFAHSGEFYRAVVHAAKGNLDKRLTFQSGMQEKIGEDGGFLIPQDFRQEIQKKVTGDQSLLSMTRQFKTTSNNLVLPTDEVAPWDGTGIQAYWEGEAGEYNESKGKFGDTQFRLHKLTALVRVTEELIEDAPALDSYIRSQAPDAMLHKVNSAIIGGDGVGKPSGILNSLFKIAQAKESGQAADTVNFANVNNMLARILPNSLPNAVWLVHPSVLPQIRAMKFDLTATSPVPVYMPPSGVSGAPYGTLYGRPLMPMMGGVRQVGDEGDLMLVDLSYYYTVVKISGIKSDISTHVHFKTDESLFKFSMRLAGQCPFKAPVTTEFGGYSLSGFVTLADRA